MVWGPSQGVGDPAPRDRTIPPFRILGPDHLFPSRNPLLPRKSGLASKFHPLTLIRTLRPPNRGQQLAHNWFNLYAVPSAAPQRGRPAVLD